MTWRRVAALELRIAELEGQGRELLERLQAAVDARDARDWMSESLAVALRYLLQAVPMSDADRKFARAALAAHDATEA